MEKGTNTKIESMSPLLIVSDVENSIDFYGKQLGFTVDFTYEGFYAGIVKDGFSIHLKRGDPILKGRKLEKNSPVLQIIFSVLNLEELYEEFCAKPIEIIQPLRQMPYGKEFYIADPDRNIHAFLSTK